MKGVCVVSACSFVRKRRVVFRGQAVTVPLSCEAQRETFSKITTSFNIRFTAPPELLLLDLARSKLSFR
ncbi:hypothetical protein E2C01_042841 [Portunus trituberculatus]|uniref:Uncharacterized protein n=1 Tax=Portunus trituberculatus TaxID=210409 RepID=A0A5B7FNM2_PORTR|nr:hypothetical protein [Portunus trituberculatus]